MEELTIEIMSTIVSIILIAGLTLYLIYIVLTGIITEKIRLDYKKKLNEEEQKTINKYLDQKASLKNIFKRKENKK